MKYVILVPSVDDALEISSLERSATDETTVDIRLREELRSVRSLARTAIEDSGVISNLFAIYLSNARTDVSMYFLSLLSSSSLTSADSPDWLVSDNDVLPFLSSEIEYRASELSLNYLILLVSLTLFERLTDAEEHLETISESELYLFLENFRSLVIVLTTL